MFATPIVAIITFVTVVGVPIGLIGLTLYGIAIYLSQIAVGLFIGYWIIGSFSKVESRGILVGALALGFLILTLLKLIPYVLASVPAYNPSREPGLVGQKYRLDGDESPRRFQ